MRSFLLLACLTVLATAQDEPAPRAPAGEPSLAEIQMLRRILELPPERLTRIRAAIEKMERMPAGARREFADRLAKLENASPEERRALSRDMRERGGFGGRLIEYHLRKISPEQARQERERVGAMSPEDRMEFVRSLSEKYPEFSKEKRPEMKDGKMKHRPPGSPAATN